MSALWNAKASAAVYLLFEQGMQALFLAQSSYSNYYRKRRAVVTVQISIIIIVIIIITILFI